jgi:hypothetical protein
MLTNNKEYDQINYKVHGWILYASPVNHFFFLSKQAKPTVRTLSPHGPIGPHPLDPTTTHDPLHPGRLTPQLTIPTQTVSVIVHAPGLHTVARGRGARRVRGGDPYRAGPRSPFMWISTGLSPRCLILPSASYLVPLATG